MAKQVQVQTTELSTLTKENSRLEGALADRDTLIGVRDDELKQATQKIEDLMNQLYELESKGFDKELKALQATIALTLIVRQGSNQYCQG